MKLHYSGPHACAHVTSHDFNNPCSHPLLCQDAHGLAHVALLGAFQPQAARVAAQLGESLRGLQAMIHGRLEPQR